MTTGSSRGAIDESSFEWGAIRRTIRRAEVLQEKARSLIAELSDACTIDESVALKYYLLFDRSRLYGLLCGTTGGACRESVPLFLNSMSLTTEQPSLALSSGRSRENVVKHLQAGRSTNAERQFFLNGVDQALIQDSTKDGPYPLARIRVVIAIVHALTQSDDASGRGASPRIEESVKREVLAHLWKVGEEFQKTIAADAKTGLGDEGVRRPHVLLERIFVAKRIHGTRTKTDGAPFAGLDEQLFAHLERLMTRGNDHADVGEISRVLRILGGATCNQGPRSLPLWAGAFREGILFVLANQRTSGDWVQPGVREDSVLDHAYTPLLDILDLDSDVLIAHLAAVGRAAERSIEVLDHEIAVLTRMWPQASDTRLDAQRFFRGVTASLAVGGTVSERLKDLLALSILESLGGEVPRTGYQWPRVSDSLSFREHLENCVIDPWLKGSPHRPGSILIFGPPGTGKTTIAKMLTEQMNERLSQRLGDIPWQFLEFTPADLARDGSDRIVAQAEWIFNLLKDMRRCVVLLDEMEEFLAERSPDSDKISRLITTALLPLLQEVVRSREIILVVATNAVGRIDPAVTRRGRFDLILPLGPPDAVSREAIIKDLVAGRPEFLTAKAVKALTYFTMGYTRAEIEDFVRQLQVEWSETMNFPMLLWRIRSEHVPTALSGGVGCNWRLFADETSRFARPGVEDADYWVEPTLPPAEERMDAGNAPSATPILGSTT